MAKLTTEEIERRQRDGKVCSRCKQHRERSEWGENASRTDGLQGLCLQCMNAISNVFSRNEKIRWLTLCCHRTRGLLVCQCCYKISDPDCLTFDHVVGGGTKDHRENGYTKLWKELQAGRKRVEDFETLCMTCNRAKHDYGICPHQNPEAYTRKLSQTRPDSIENKDIVIDALTGGSWQCAECRCVLAPWLATVDHVNGDGAAHRRVNGGAGGLVLYRQLVADFHATGQWPSGLQILCFNCNVRTKNLKYRQDATRRANGEIVPMKVETVIVQTPKLRKKGQKGVYGHRRDKNGFERYPIKDEQIRQHAAELVSSSK